MCECGQERWGSLAKGGLRRVWVVGGTETQPAGWAGGQAWVPLGSAAHNVALRQLLVTVTVMVEMLMLMVVQVLLTVLLTVVA